MRATRPFVRPLVVVVCQLPTLLVILYERKGYFHCEQINTTRKLFFIGVAQGDKFAE